MSSATAGASRIDALTGLRFFAAASIFYLHIGGHFVAPGSTTPFEFAGGVPLFFALSGFVLTVSFRSGSLRDFYIARVARIWPAHIAALLLLFTVFWPWSKVYFQSTESLISLALNILLLQDWIPRLEFYGGYNAVSWSISAELFFYAIFPAVYLAVKAAPVRSLAITVTVVVLWILLLPLVDPAIPPLWLGSMNPITGTWPFMLGIAGGFWFLRRKADFASVSRAKWTVVEVAVIASVIGMNSLFSEWDLPNASPAMRSFLSCLGPSPIYALLIVCFAMSQGHIARFLSTRLLVYLGEVSFSFYLVHQIIIRWHADYAALFGDMSNGMRLAGVLAASLAISMAIYHLVEIPARGKIRRLGRSLDLLERAKCPQAQ